MLKKWLIVGLIAVAIIVTVRMLYTLSDFSGLEVAEQQNVNRTSIDIPAPAAVIPAPAELSEQASLQAKEPKEVTLNPEVQSDLSELQIQRSAPASGAFTGRDPEGLSYSDRIQKEQTYEEIGRQRAEYRKTSPTRDASDN